MTRLLKRAALGLLTNSGYKLLTRNEYDQLQAVARAALAPAPELPPTPAPPPPTGEALPALLGDGAAPSDAAAIRDFLAASAAVSDLPLRRLALYSVAQYLCESGIGGAVMDCGYGATGTLATLAMALRCHGDTGRQLILFDTTADPTHRAELEFALWGTGRDLLAGRQAGSRAQIRSEPPPADLVATGYPAANFSIRRYPREEIAGCGQLAFLGLTSQTYPANEEAAAIYFPLLSRGGVIAVEGPLGSAADAVDRYLRREGIALLLVQVAPDFRLGIKP